MFVQVVSLTIAMQCMVALSFATGDDHHQLTQLVQRAQSLHDQFQRSLVDIDSYIGTHADLELKVRHRRDDASLLKESYFAFCQTLLNTASSSSSPPPSIQASSFPSSFTSLSSTNSTAPQTAARASPPRDWDWEHARRWPLQNDIVVLSASVVRKSFFVAFVEFTVVHSEVGYVMPRLEIWNTGSFKKKKLRVKSKESVPKTSTVRFRIKTHWCVSFKVKPPVTFLFTSRAYMKSVQTSVQVDVCEPVSTNATNITSPVFPVKARFHYGLSNSDLTVKRGENFTLVVEMSPESFDHQAPKVHFLVRTCSYNNKTKHEAYSSIVIAKSDDNKSPNHFTIHQSPMADQPLSSFTSVEEVSPPSDSSDISTHGHKAKAAYLKVTFNTASGEDTAAVFFYQRELFNDPDDSHAEGHVGGHDRGHTVESTQLGLPLMFLQRGHPYPLPRGRVFTLHNPKQVCNINRFSQTPDYGGGYCGVRCDILGVHIFKIAIIRKYFPENTTGELLTARGSHWMSVLRRMTLPKPEDGGLFECRILHSNGDFQVFDIELRVGGRASIDRYNSKVETGNDTKTFICAATGTDLDVAVNKIEYGPKGPKITRLDTKDQFEKTKFYRTEDHYAFSLMVPLSALGDGTADIVCNATNYMNSDVMYFPTSAVYGDVENLQQSGIQDQTDSRP